MIDLHLFIWLSIYAVLFQTLSYAIRAIDSRNPALVENVDSEHERLIAAAMEELDDIDRVMGLLPAKPALTPSTRIDVDSWYWQREYNRYAGYYFQNAKFAKYAGRNWKIGTGNSGPR